MSVVVLGPSARESAFAEEIEHTARAEDTLRKLRRLKRRSREIKRNLVDLELKRDCLHHGLQKWNKLSEKARGNMQGSEVLAKKYPDSLRTEAIKLKAFYRRVNERLMHERADIESQILADDGQIDREVERREACEDARGAELGRYRLLRNRIDNCQELQRHCLFSSTLWQPTPA